MITGNFSQREFLLLATIVLGSIVTWETNRCIILQARKKYPKLEHTKKRVRTSFILCLIATYISWLSFYLIDYYLIYGLSTSSLRILNVAISDIFQSVFLVFIIGGVYESVYYYLRLRQSEHEKEELLRNNLQSRFDSLQGQVNPHFLFNSLNSLRQLILKDPQQAAHYVEELSDVYRYLLKNIEEGITTVEKEIDFIQSYFHLLRTRFSKGLILSIDVSPELQHHQIPPLTLQMLVENAVKHNIISVNRPLHIHIKTENGKRLTITNNLQKKLQHLAPSEGIGLTNIMTKYHLLKQPEVIIRETETEFTVSLPLIKNEQYESAYY